MIKLTTSDLTEVGVWYWAVKSYPNLGSELRSYLPLAQAALQDSADCYHALPQALRLQPDLIMLAVKAGLELKRLPPLDQPVLVERILTVRGWTLANYRALRLERLTMDWALNYLLTVLRREPANYYSEFRLFNQDQLMKLLPVNGYVISWLDQTPSLSA